MGAIYIYEPFERSYYKTTKEALLYNLMQINEFVTYTPKPVLFVGEYLNFFTPMSLTHVDFKSCYMLGWDLKSTDPLPKFSYKVKKAGKSGLINGLYDEVYVLKCNLKPKPLYFDTGQRKIVLEVDKLFKSKNCLTKDEWDKICSDILKEEQK